MCPKALRRGVKQEIWMVGRTGFKLNGSNYVFKREVKKNRKVFTSRKRVLGVRPKKINRMQGGKRGKGKGGGPKRKNPNTSKKTGYKIVSKGG